MLTDAGLLTEGSSNIPYKTADSYKFQSESWIQIVLKVNLTFRITQSHFARVLCEIIAIRSNTRTIKVNVVLFSFIEEKRTKRGTPLKS